MSHTFNVMCVENLGIILASDLKARRERELRVGSNKWLLQQKRRRSSWLP
jgi:hypothetical protein